MEDINVQALFICSPKEPKAGRREQTHFMAIAVLMFFTSLPAPFPNCSPIQSSRSLGPICLTLPPSCLFPGEPRPGLGKAGHRDSEQESDSHTVTELGQGQGPGLLPPIPCPFHCQTCLEAQAPARAAPEEARPLALLSLHPVLPRHWDPQLAQGPGVLAGGVGVRAKPVLTKAFAHLPGAPCYLVPSPHPPYPPPLGGPQPVLLG